jgi:hypothetical protein
MGKPVAISAHKGGSDDAISKRAGHRGCLVRGSRRTHIEF